MLPPLAHPCDLDVPVVDSARASRSLAAASAAVRAAAGSSITRTQSVATFASYDRWLRLPGPVVSVASVALDGQPVTDWVRHGDRLWRACGWGSSKEEGPCMITVDFIHGLNEVPADIVKIVADLAGADLLSEGPRDHREQAVSIDDYRRSYGGAGDASASIMELPDRTKAMLAARFGGSCHIVDVIPS